VPVPGYKSVTVTKDVKAMVQSLAKLLGWSENQVIESCIGEIIEQSKLPPEERSMPAIIQYAWERRQAALKKTVGVPPPGPYSKPAIAADTADAFSPPKKPPAKGR
jgi:hypothetical protein